MNSEEKKRKLEELDQLFSDTQSSNPVENTSLATLQDLPDLPEVKLYDYDKDLDEVSAEGKDVIENMAGLYLNNNEEVLAHPYIKKKIEHDATNHADMLFLRKMAQRAIIMQLKEIDKGDITPRSFETFYQGLREIREINKQSTQTQNIVETFYKTLKDDLGLQDKPLVATQQETTTDGNTNLPPTDQKNLNSLLSDILKKKNNKG